MPEAWLLDLGPGKLAILTITLMTEMAGVMSSLGSGIKKGAHAMQFPALVSFVWRASWDCRGHWAKVLLSLCLLA